MLNRFIRVICLCLLTVVPVSADELADAAQTLCGKLKSCAMSQMAGQDLTPQAREMIQPMLDNLCTQMYGYISNVPHGHPLYNPALACAQSMNSLSCDMMQDAVQQQKTPACETLANLARKSEAGT